MPLSPRRRRSDLADLIRSILAARGLSLAEIARQSDVRFAGNPLFRIPANFYDSLRRASFTPSAHQLYALSVLTGYQLADWMSVFGFSLDEAARFQASRTRYRTTELDSHIYDPGAVVLWYEEKQPAAFGPELTPLTQWLSGKAIRPLNSLSDRIGASFRYLKIGTRDAYPFPDLLPGSIVRISNRIPSEQLLARDNANRILAIEDGRGVFCGRLRVLPRDRVVLCPGQVPYAPVELELGKEARILGYVDMEIRQLETRESPEVRASWNRSSTPDSSKPSSRLGQVSDLIRGARIRSGLSFREASERTAEIARLLGHPNYYCSPGTLSDLEARDLVPRRVHKLISLSAIYCIPVANLVDRADLRLRQAGQEPMPTRWKDALLDETPGKTLRPSPLLAAMEREFEEIPFFLRKALPELLGLPNLSVRDLFWAGDTTGLTHPYLNGAVLLAVNRRSKTPVPSFSSPVWAQPLYVLEMRGGKLLCAACCLKDGTLTVRPCTTVSGGLLRLRHGIDAEVLGKVVAVLRRLAIPDSLPIPTS